MSCILFIEDDMHAQRVYSMMLKEYGYDVILASSYKDAEEQLKICSPDLILCDIMLPDYSGIKIKELYNKSEATRDIPFIFITALEEYKSFRKGMDLGADGYLIKPVPMEELLKVVKSRLDRVNNN